MKTKNVRFTKDGVLCDRTTPLGNPFFMKNESERSLVIQAFRLYLYRVAVLNYTPEKAARDVASSLKVRIPSTWKKPSREEFMSMLDKLQELQKDLLCHCAPEACHCDVIISYLNWKINSQ